MPSAVNAVLFRLRTAREAADVLINIVGKRHSPACPFHTDAHQPDASIFSPLAVCTQSQFDTLPHQRRFLERMFPNPNNSPATVLKTTDNFSVPCRISVNFILPVTPIGLWQPPVSFASMPKTSINENDKTFTAKNKVRLAGKFHIPSPAGDSILPKNGNQFEFGSLVSL